MLGHQPFEFVGKKIQRNEVKQETARIYIPNMDQPLNLLTSIMSLQSLELSYQTALRRIRSASSISATAAPYAVGHSLNQGPLFQLL